MWRRNGERNDPANVMERDRYGGVMIWGGICHRAKTDVVTVAGNLNVVRYCDEIIRPVVVPFLRRRHAQIFQQDNARPHSARLTMGVLRDNNIEVLVWPARSPDLSPIEHLWDYIGRKLRERNDVINVRDLQRALVEEWQRTPMTFVRKLINSMRRRCDAVIAARGGHTRY
ncbi:MAG: transposase [Sedimenticola sp.]